MFLFLSFETRLPRESQMWTFFSTAGVAAGQFDLGGNSVDSVSNPSPLSRSERPSASNVLRRERLAREWVQANATTGR